MTERLVQLYTPIEVAVGELLARRHATASLPTDPLAVYLHSDRFAVIFRQVASPNFELERFAALAQATQLTPLVLEYYGDRFLTRNTLKCALAKLRFSRGYMTNDARRIPALAVTSLASSDNHAFRDIRTYWGQPLVSFHHELLGSVPALASIRTLDITDWLQARGPDAAHNYTSFFSLFVNGAILFEDFLLTPQEQIFTTEIVIPAFEMVFSNSGARPLICRIDPTDDAGSSSWFHYPLELLPRVINRFSNTHLKHKRTMHVVSRPRRPVSVGTCAHGLGVFAQRHFSAGETILGLSGRPLTFDEAHTDANSSFNMLQVAPQLYLELDPPGIFINHSCAPNAGIAHDLLLVSLGEIAPGDEICFDYSTTMKEVHGATMRCTCGSAHCRHLIADFDCLPIERQQFYLRHGVVQSFISHARAISGNA